MKKIAIIMLALCCLFITGCDTEEEPGLNGNDPAPRELTPEEKAENRLKEMTIEEKIGQMLIIFYSSTAVDETLTGVIEDIQPGGFIIFDHNIDNKAQLIEFTGALQELSRIPIFISIDQEGGLVQRLKSKNDLEITRIPPMLEIGQTGDRQLAYETGKTIGEELSRFGINMNFAPVIDIFSNPNNTVIGNRAFGSETGLVSEMGISLANGLSDSNVIPVYKHFPGHGDTDEDSHFVLPVIRKSLDELMELELIPFIDAIQNDAAVIMIGHLALPEVTGDNIPASLSGQIINGLLRGQLGFDGVVITDAVNMAALADNYTTKEICIKAINAGVDLILMPVTSRTAMSGILEGLEEGLITADQIDTAVKRILTLKYETIIE